MLDVSGLVSGYGKSEVLREIDLKIAKGQVVTIIGPNGAGKTTLFRTIFGLLPVRKGQVLFEGEDLAKLPPLARIKRGIALVPQGRAVFPDLSVLENMEMGAYTITDKRQVQDAMEECYHLFPVLRERKKQRAATLSGGEQQMLVIARALMSRPRFVMLDEPSLGLAPLLVRQVFETVKAINGRGITVLLVEQNVFHCLSTAARGYVLENGSVVLEGGGKELLNNPQVREAYLGI